MADDRFLDPDADRLDAFWDELVLTGKAVASADDELLEEFRFVQRLQAARPATSPEALARIHQRVIGGKMTAIAPRSTASQLHTNLPRDVPSQRWTIGQFAANATLLVLVALVGAAAWYGIGGLRSPGSGDEPTVGLHAPLVVASPELESAATPVTAGEPAITECDLEGDIPIVTQLQEGESPLSQTSLYLTHPESTTSNPRGTLTIGCAGEERVVLAENVVAVWQGPWPGVAAFGVLPPEVDDLTQQQQGYVDIASGRSILFGPSKEWESGDLFHAEGSPWVAGPSADSSGELLVADLRTFETKPFSETVGMPAPGGPLLVSTPSDDGALAVGFARNGSIDANGGIYMNVESQDAPDGVLLLGSSFDDVRWIPSPGDHPHMSPIAVSPDGAVLATISSGEGEGVPESFAYGLLDLTTGELIGSSGEVPFLDTPRILWVNDGAAAAYLSGSTLQILSIGESSEPVTVFDAGEQLSQLRTTWSPEVVVVSERRDHGSDADATLTAEDRVYSINLTTGETHEFAGIDASSMIGWMTSAGALVMFEWSDAQEPTANYEIYDPVTASLVGEITDVPSLQSPPPPMIFGPNSMAISDGGLVQVVTFGTPHLYSIVGNADGMDMTRLPSPSGLLSETVLTANVYLSPDGSQLSLMGDGDEGRTRYLMEISEPAAEWMEIPSGLPGGPGPVMFVRGE